MLQRVHTPYSSQLCVCRSQNERASMTTTTTTTTTTRKNHHHLFTSPFLVSFLFRVTNSFLFLRTFHSADEHYQSVEIAHEFIFKYGVKTWEWREDVKLRSFVHPLFLYAWPYALVKGWLDEDARTTVLVRAMPRVVNARSALSSTSGRTG